LHSDNNGLIIYKYSEMKNRTTNHQILGFGNAKPRFILSIISLVFSIFLLGCGDDDDNRTGLFDKEEKSCENSDHENYRTIELDSETREYILHVPSSYDGNTSSPLVINFHGFGDCASTYATNVGASLGLNLVADDNNFLVVYPQAAFREKGDVYWEPGDNGSQSINENDVYFTKQLISEISGEYNIDESRVYAVGYSNGGMMSYDLACNGSDFIAAVGIMSGISLSETCEVADAYTSVIHFHGIGDDVLPFEGDENYFSVSEVINSWLDHNNIPASSLETTELNNGDVVRDVYTGGSENTSVVLYTVNSEFEKVGGHVWFSEDIDEVPPSQILWDFLSQHSL